MAHREPVVLVLVALLLVLAACGAGSSGGEGVATAGGRAGEGPAGSDQEAERDPQEAALEFARCMREQGVDMPDPEVDENGRMLIRREAGDAGPSQGMAIDDEAHEACRHLLEGLVGPGDAKIDAEEQDRALQFARCMREHGVNMPDPDFSDGGVGFRIVGEGLDPDSPAMKAAQEACKEFFGPPGGGAGGGPEPAESPS